MIGVERTRRIRYPIPSEKITLWRRNCTHTQERHLIKHMVNTKVESFPINLETSNENHTEAFDQTHGEH